MNPKLVISQYFDNLIRQIDIFTEEQLEKSTTDELVEVSLIQKGFLNTPDKQDCVKIINDEWNFDQIDDIHEYGRAIWTQIRTPVFDLKPNLLEKSEREMLRDMKQKDYLSRAREKMLAELTKLQEEAFRKYESIRNEIKLDKTDQDNLEEIQRRIFDGKFPFLAEYKRPLIQLFLIVSDFYIEKNERNRLK